MRHILVLMALLAGTGTMAYAKTPLQIAREVENAADNDTIQFPAIKQYADSAVNGALDIAMTELRRKGFNHLAEEIFSEWNYTYGRSMFLSTYNIGDHKPVLQFLADIYEKIEAALTRPICIKLHISDIKSLNHGIPVAIHPCTFPMDAVLGDRSIEYARHLNGGPQSDDAYYGVLPVCVYWAVRIGCSAAGVSAIVCPIAADIGERIMNLAGVWIANRIYIKHCGG